MPAFSKLPPLSLYIHFPWCVRKCPYCDFNSHELKHSLAENDYINLLLRDLENDLPRIWGRKIHSIFMGGGTPSLFSPEAMDALLSGIRARIPLAPNAEITMEANPGTLENKRLNGFRDAGINRVSFGAQSFDNTSLNALGRIHNADAIYDAMEKAKSAGFQQINLDLMFALPGQTQDKAAKDVETAISLDPTHISYYQLTIEANTAFYRNPPVLPDDELSWEIFSLGKEKLQAAGYSQYEVSAYAKPAAQCKHNLNYWHFGDYLGIGAGAHGKISDANSQSITRMRKHKHPRQYAEGQNFIAEENILQKNDIIFEFLMNALRLEQGFDHHTFLDNTGLSILDLNEALQKPIDQGLIGWPELNAPIKPTIRGKLFLNDLLQMCLPE